MLNNNIYTTEILALKSIALISFFAVAAKSNYDCITNIYRFFKVLNQYT